VKQRKAKMKKKEREKLIDRLERHDLLV